VLVHPVAAVEEAAEEEGHHLNHHHLKFVKGLILTMIKK
jgi:hypothetical protein